MEVNEKGSKFNNKYNDDDYLRASLQFQFITMRIFLFSFKYVRHAVKLDRKDVAYNI